MTEPSLFYSALVFALFALLAASTWFSLQGTIVRWRLNRQGKLTFEALHKLPLFSQKIGLKLGVFVTLLNLLTMLLFGAAVALSLSRETMDLSIGACLAGIILFECVWFPIEVYSEKWLNRNFYWELRGVNVSASSPLSF